MNCEKAYETVRGMNEEERFLSAYRIDDYDRPSVAVDTAVFSIRSESEISYKKDPELRLCVLLIRRGEHPFKDSWALPGGFAKRGETLEQCAQREVREETNLHLNALMSVGAFSEPERDPRGWIISNAYASIISEEKVQIMGGSDAVDSRWFHVSYSVDEGGAYELKLRNGDILLSARLRCVTDTFDRPHFELEENNGLAFDHAKIIVAALSMLRGGAERYTFVFDFLPEKFTLTALQKVQETLLGISLLPANFRRRAAEYVTETDEYTEGAGHRPARLFIKNTKR